jgi:hypothetical protein
MSGSSKVSLHGLQFFPEWRQISDVSCVADFPALRFPPGNFGLGTPQGCMSERYPNSGKIATNNEGGNQAFTLGTWLISGV